MTDSPENRSGNESGKNSEKGPRAGLGDGPAKGSEEKKTRNVVGDYLRQRRELGEQDFFLEALSSSQAVELAGRTGTPTASPVEGEPPVATEGGHFPVTAGTPVPGTQGRPPDTTAAGKDSPPVDLSPLDLSNKEYDEVRGSALSCTRCRLGGVRTQAVFSDGNPNARLMVVGEAPGQREDETGLAFVGPAGGLLDLLLAAVGLSREESVYICNVIKCRPPGNRNPLPDEIEACAPFLRRQIEMVEPEAILAVGTFSGQLLTGKELPLGRLRGTVYSYEGAPLVVTYHPAALLRNSGWTKATWDDFQLLREIMDGDSGEHFE